MLACVINGSEISFTVYCMFIYDLLRHNSMRAMIDCTDLFQRNACHYAALYGHNAALEILVLFGAPFWDLDGSGLASVHICAALENNDTIELLLRLIAGRPNFEAFINQQDTDGRTAVHWAAELGRIHNLMILHTYGAILAGMVDNNGSTPLHLAIADVVCTEYLVYHAFSGSPEVNATDAEGCTALLRATMAQDVAVVSALLQAQDIATDAVDGQGRSALHWAFANNDVAVAAALLQVGAKYTTPDVDGLGPLHYAAMYDHVECTQLLVQLDPTVLGCLDARARTPLMQATANGSIRALQVMLQAAMAGSAADMAHLVGMVDEDGRSAIHYAAYANNTAALPLLRDAGCDTVDAQDTQGTTPVMLACEQGHVELLRAMQLAGYGTSLELCNNTGKRALHIATVGGHASCVEHLLDNGARLDAVDERGETPLHYAAFFGHVGVAELLIAASDRQAAQSVSPVDDAIRGGAAAPPLTHTLDARDLDGICPLHWAARQGHVSTVQLLLGRGAYANFPDHSNTRATPLDFALEAGHMACVEVLEAYGAVVGQAVLAFAATILQGYVRGWLVRRCLHQGKAVAAPVEEGSGADDGARGITPPPDARDENPADGHASDVPAEDSAQRGLPVVEETLGSIPMQPGDNAVTEELHPTEEKHATSTEVVPPPDAVETPTASFAVLPHDPQRDTLSHSVAHEAVSVAPYEVPEGDTDQVVVHDAAGRTPPAVGANATNDHHENDGSVLTPEANSSSGSVDNSASVFGGPATSLSVTVESENVANITAAIGNDDVAVAETAPSGNSAAATGASPIEDTTIVTDTAATHAGVDITTIKTDTADTTTAAPLGSDPGAERTAPDTRDGSRIPAASRDDENVNTGTTTGNVVADSPCAAAEDDVTVCDPTVDVVTAGGNDTGDSAAEDTHVLVSATPSDTPDVTSIALVDSELGSTAESHPRDSANTTLQRILVPSGEATLRAPDEASTRDVTREIRDSESGSASPGAISVNSSAPFTPNVQEPHRSTDDSEAMLHATDDQPNVSSVTDASTHISDAGRRESMRVMAPRETSEGRGDSRQSTAAPPAPLATAPNDVHATMQIVSAESQSDDTAATPFRAGCGVQQSDAPKHTPAHVNRDALHSFMSPTGATDVTVPLRFVAEPAHSGEDSTGGKCNVDVLLQHLARKTSQHRETQRLRDFRRKARAAVVVQRAFRWWRLWKRVQANADRRSTARPRPPAGPIPPVLPLSAIYLSVSTLSLPSPLSNGSRM